MLTLVDKNDPILRKTAVAVMVFDSQICQIAKEMMALMKEHQGVGLAAPQVGISQQIITIDAGKGALILVNPQIIYQSQDLKDDKEGCLSLPGASLKIARPNKVTVAFQDEFGAKHEIKAKGLTARVLQHEIDHLNGILITDRVKQE